jgi:hypothetical protein
MQFNYTLTVDDIAEAAKPTGTGGQPISDAAQFVRGPLGWVIFVALALLIFWMVTSGGPQQQATLSPAVPPSQNLWVTLVPNLIPACVAILFIATSQF